MADAERRHGALRERLHFQKRGDGDDGMGTVIPGIGDFETVFTAYSGMRPRTGGEEVTAARLAGRQPYVVTVRNSSQTRAVTTAWRLVDARNENRIFAISSPLADPDGKNQWLEFIATEGEAS
jgi:head-tail adaptor